MKLTYTTPDGKMTVEIEGNSDKELFRKLSHFQEIFCSIPAAKIGDKVVEGGDVIYRVRKANYTDEKGKQKDAEYFEAVTKNGPLAWFKRSFGVLDDGTDNLFPKRPSPDEPNLEIGFDGWHRYKKPQ
jgi:hypothetical protein